MANSLGVQCNMSNSLVKYNLLELGNISSTRLFCNALWETMFSWELALRSIEE